MKKKFTRREDYLKLIYTLSKKGEVRGADLAVELDVKRPIVSVYLKQLIENGDITMDKHHTVHLTEQGQQVAMSILDKHSLLCTLFQSLGIPYHLLHLGRQDHSRSEGKSRMKKFLNTALLASFIVTITVPLPVDLPKLYHRARKKPYLYDFLM